MGNLKEMANHTTKWIIHKFENDAAFKAGDHYERVEIDGNLLLNEGINIMWALICGIGSETPYNNANAQLGVGSTATAAAATQTDLLDVSAEWKGMEATYPQVATQTATFRSVFATGDGNYAWNEFSVRNGATADENMNRKVSAQGTKASGQTWTLDLEITLS